MVAVLALAPAALAAPKGAFAVFSDCPLTVSVGCLYTKTTSGKFVVGKQTVPITNPITLQSGYIESPTGGDQLIGATDGKTLSKSPQNVPGGLLDFVNCKEISNFIERIACELVFENGVTGVNATAELEPVKPVILHIGNTIEEEGNALTLPVRLHLENTFLGSECYIGTSTAPMEIELTTGKTSPPLPNKPISGKAGTLEFPEEGKIEVLKNALLVNNTFSAPAANGCGGAFSFLIDPIIDSKLGLPASSGHNTAELGGNIEISAAEYVKESE